MVTYMIAGPTVADYVKPQEIISVSTDTDWLYNAVGDGVEAGAKSVSEDLLSNVAEALVRSYAPEVADLLFGGSNELERHTQRVLDEIQATHRDLARRHRDLFDEVMDQFSVDLTGRLRSASDLMSSWLASDDLLRRYESAEVVREAMNDFNEVRTTLEEYIRSGATPAIQYRRLQLLGLQITAAQLAVIASGYYWGTISIRTTFLRSSYGGEESRFDEWEESLSATDIAAIEAMNPEVDLFQRSVYEQVFAFYEDVAGADAVADFLDDVVTPPVSQMEVFQESTALYDNPGVVTDRSSWGLRGGGRGALSRLDGLRWYYYAAIPQPPEGPGATCLEGWAFDALTVRDRLPWVELEESPAASECNRFWILDPYLVSSGWPNTSLGSFDAYSLWFEDGAELYALHRSLIHGDLVRAIYGPASLILDRMYLEVHDGGSRHENRWDRILETYDRRVAMLGVADSYTDGRSWEQVRAAEAALREWGATHSTLGLRDWQRALSAYVVAPDRAKMALQAVGIARGTFDWMQRVAQGDGGLSPGRVQLTPSDVRLALLGEASVYARYLDGVASVIAAELPLRMRGEAGAKTIAVL